jgi:two-component system, NarL family, sensor histidine kinase DegS
VTDGTVTPLAGTQPLAARAAALARKVPHRLRERPFWLIQTGVLAVTALHILAELWADAVVAGVHPALHHVPVILYLAPIAYASLRYGIEGAFLTGVWAALLTLPNILVFHAQHLEWLTELVYVGVVISAGVIMAVPVERERRQRQHAEATSRRLGLLNEIATLTLTADTDRALHGSLASLVAVLDLDAACVAVAAPEDPTTLSTLARHPVGAGAEAVDACLAHLDPPRDTGRVRTVGEGILAIPFDTDLPDPGPAGRVSGLLAVRPHPGRPLSPDDHQLLVGVGNQLAIALANARLKDLERDRIHSYARLVTEAQEEERKRISRELHDEAAQNLVAIRRGLDAISAQLTSEESLIPELKQTQDLAGQTLAGVRRFSRDLRPPVLDDLGLGSALESLVQDMRRRSDLTISLTTEGPPLRLPTEIELLLFRVAQAALHNVEQHANATHASLRLRFDADRIHLAVTDDGDGFELPTDSAELARSGKLGLLGMQERAHLAGAILDITTTSGSGTCVEVVVPR